MAIDHVRVYSGVPPGSLDPAVFFTRWITNFCAPGFAFFAGTAAFLYGNKTGDKAGLARFRGLLLPCYPRPTRRRAPWPGSLLSSGGHRCFIICYTFPSSILAL